MLKFFNKKQYKNLGDALGDVQKELESLQPLDSSTVKWQRQNNGITATVIGINHSGTQPSDSDISNTTITAVGYNSYFKIVDISETGTDGSVTRKFAVKDGAGREHNRCKVNNKVFNIPDYTSEPATQTVLIALRFSSTENDVTIQVRKALELPDDTSEYSWYQIGMFIIDGNGVKVQQDHLTGVAQMFWYDICGD